MKRIGVIAEDVSDVDVLRELIQKMDSRKGGFTIRRFVGHGCGRMVSKCRHWAQALQAQNCTLLIMVHDLDRRRLSALHQQLVDAINPCPIRKTAIVIPVKAIEAWLLSDTDAIRRALNIQASISTVSNPEAIADPKKKLEELVFSRSRKTRNYVNTIHNRLIAAEITIEKIRRCQSFTPLEDFIKTNL